MNIIDLKHIERVIVCGDIHGLFSELAYKVSLQYQIKDSLVIVAGDCGFGFESEEYYNQIFNKINKKVNKYNNTFVFVRGNHDDPSFFNENKINKPNFFTVKDYTVIQTKNKNILCVGGATSIDRTDRIRRQEMQYAKKKFYWRDEGPIYNEVELNDIKLNNINIDTVITHTSPDFCEKISKDGISGWADYDKNLIKDCDKERMVISTLYNKLRSDGHSLENWVYGHFHMSWWSSINNTNFTLLDILELKEIR